VFSGSGGHSIWPTTLYSSANSFVSFEHLAALRTDPNYVISDGGCCGARFFNVYAVKTGVHKAISSLTIDVGDSICIGLSDGKLHRIRY